jgi:ribosomal protein S18 acetylase RimI-like enzyme
MLLAISERPLNLNCVKTNEAALSLYQRFGLKVTREFEGNRSGKSIPVVRMTLDEQA